MKNPKLWLSMLLVGSMLIFTGCGDDDEGPANLEVQSLTASGTDLETGETVDVDLNGATSAQDVPLDASIDIVFSREVDPASATTANVTISDGTDAVSANVSATGNTITITPSEELERGTTYTITVSGAVVAADGGKFTSVSRSFKTAGRAAVVPPNQDSQVAYWRFDGDATDQLDTYDANAEVAIEYQSDRFGQMNSTAYFNGDESIIEVPDASPLLLDTESFTVSFWLKTDTEGHVNADGDLTGMFVFGLGAGNGIQYEIFDAYDGSKFAISYVNTENVKFVEDMWFPSEATDNTTGGWQGWDFAKSLTVEQMQGIIKDKWYHVIYSYNAAEKNGSLYYNGELMKSFDFDLWPDGDAKQTAAGVTYKGTEPEVFDDLAFGFIHSRAGTLFDSEPWGSYDLSTSKHFKGWLDDFRIFHAAFTAADATALYNAEKP